MEFKKIITTPLAHSATLTPTRKKSISRSKQHEFIQLWQESKLSKRAFCQQHDIHVKTFSNWCRQANELSGTQACRTEKPSENILAQADQLSIAYANGMHLTLTGKLEKSWLLIVMKEMGQCKSN